VCKPQSVETIVHRDVYYGRPRCDRGSDELCWVFVLLAIEAMVVVVVVVVVVVGGCEPHTPDSALPTVTTKLPP